MSKRVMWLSGIITLIVGLATFTATLGPRSGFLVWGDGLAYFLYARSIVLDFDTDITQGYETLDARFPANSPLMISLRDWAHRNTKTGKIVVPWPVGSGLVMAPFYALGYSVELMVAALTGRPADSYGLIPQYFYGFGSLIYGLLGFWATFLCCRRVADKKTAYLASLAVILGGPAVYYMFFQPSMAHVPSYGLISLLTLLWWRCWYEEAHGIALPGLILGLLITIRYQNILFSTLLVVLVLREASQTSLSRALRTACIMMGACLIPLTLQGFHYITIHGLSGEAIDWQAGSGLLVEPAGIATKIPLYTIDPRSPNFFKVLFSCQAGAFYWAPILALGFAGILWAARKECWAWVFLVTFLSQVYLIGGLRLANSVYGEWVTNSMFGMRYLTECGPFLAVGLAVLTRDITRWVRAFWWQAVLGLLVTWNGFLILAYGLNTISRGAHCVTYREMLEGIIKAITIIVVRK